MSRDNALLKDIVESAKSIRHYVAGISKDDFMANEEKQDAVVRRIEVIGEAARHLSPKAKESFPQIPWALISGMRNRLIHDYDDVDVETVWDTAQNDLPPLISRLEEYFSNLPAD